MLVFGAVKQLKIFGELCGNKRTVKQEGEILVVLITQVGVKHIAAQVRREFKKTEPYKAAVPGVKGIPSLAGRMVNYVFSSAVNGINSVCQQSAFHYVYALLIFFAVGVETYFFRSAFREGVNVFIFPITQRSKSAV